LQAGKDFKILQLATCSPISPQDARLDQRKEISDGETFAIRDAGQIDSSRTSPLTPLEPARCLRHPSRHA